MSCRGVEYGVWGLGNVNKPDPGVRGQETTCKGRLWRAAAGSTRGTTVGD